MRFIFFAAASCVIAGAASADDAAQVHTEAQECVDITQIPSGQGLARQLECVVNYHGKIHILRARMCTLPDGTWVLNAYWNCNTDK